MSQAVSLSIALTLLLCPFLLAIVSAHWLKARKQFRETQDRHSESIRLLSEAESTRKMMEEQFHVANSELAQAKQRLELFEERFAGILDLDKEVQRLSCSSTSISENIEKLRIDYAEKKKAYDALSAEVAIFDERLAFAEMGVYEPHFEFSDSEEYKRAVEEVRERQKAMVSENRAVSCGINWTVDGSAAKGRTMTGRAIRLTLRAFNNECEAAIVNTRWNNVNAMEKRITRSFEQLNKLNESNTIAINPEYLKMKLTELFLAHEYREKLKTEREERAESLRAAREEQRLFRDLEKAQEDEERYVQLLEKAKSEASRIVGPKLDAFSDQIKALEQDLATARQKLERAKAMAEQTRSGYVYIISNIGSFGEGIVKIGLTRRLDPIDRVRELGDASVPFIFDTHAMIYSEDAPSLERALHNEFESFRVNTQNFRKEFFRVTLQDVESALSRLAPDAPFFKDIEAQEYQETLARRRVTLENQTVNYAFPDEI